MNSCCFPPRSFYDVHKYFHYLLASKLARQIQGGITAYIPEFQVRASRNERTRRRKIVADDSLHQRCHTEAVLRIHVGAAPVDRYITATIQPASTHLRPGAQPPARLARQRPYHLYGQPLAGLAVPARIDALGAQPLHRAPDCPGIGRCWHEPSSFHACIMNTDKRHHRRIQPLAAIEQTRFGRCQQSRAREHIEDIHRADLSNAKADVLPMLMQLKLDIMMAHGWPLGCGVDTW